MTAAQGAQVCQDIQAWIPQANSQDMPRVNATLSADEVIAQGTSLGDDLVSLDQDLQSENSAALMPGPPGDPQDTQNLSQDCQAYGVTLNWQASLWE
jgi:hypothetical protein